MTIAQLSFAAYCTVLLATSVVFALYSRAAALDARRWATVGYRRCGRAACKAEVSEHMAKRHADRAELWVKAGRPQCHDDSEVLAAIVERHEREAVA